MDESFNFVNHPCSPVLNIFSLDVGENESDPLKRYSHFLTPLIGHFVDLEILKEFVGLGVITGEYHEMISTHTTVGPPSSLCYTCRPCSTITPATPAAITAAITVHGSICMCAEWPDAHKYWIDCYV